MQKKQGFTLVELLIVIAVIGVLAGVSLLVVNPKEQFSRASDSQRKDEIESLAKALVAYQATHNNSYPAVGSMLTSIQSDNTVYGSNATPSAVGGTVTPCTSGEQLGTTSYCYKLTSGQAQIYTLLQSSTQNSSCGSGKVGYFIWRSATEKTTIDCVNSGTEPATP